jgi:hypothetical protein
MVQGAVPEPTEGDGNGPPIVRLVSFEPAETLHQIKGRAVDLNRINRRPTMEPLAPSSGPPPHAGAARANERYQQRAAA